MLTEAENQRTGNSRSGPMNPSVIRTSQSVFEVQTRKAKQPERGFTLIELMVVLGVIGILVGLLMPAVQSARETARRVRCQSRLKQAALALHNYHDQHGVLPPGSLKIGTAYRPFSGWGWCAMVLPQLDQGALYNVLDFETNNLVHPNGSAVQTPLPSLFCPSDSSPSTIFVQGEFGGATRIAAGNILGVEPLLQEVVSARFATVTDGLSNTFLLGEHQYEIDPDYGDEATSSWIGIATFETEWVTNSVPHFPIASFSRINSGIFSSGHPFGCNFALADGSVRFFSENMDESVYLALGTKNGGEIVSF